MSAQPFKRTPAGLAVPFDYTGRTLKPLVCVPLGGSVHPDAFRSFIHIARRGWDWAWRPPTRTDANRNEFARGFLEQTDCTHIVMLDQDHAHPYDIVERLMAWAHRDAARYQVVCALAFMRTPPFSPAMYARANADDPHVHYPLEWDKGIVSVERIGHAAVMIAREVFDKLTPPYWAFDPVEWDRGEYPSEDFYFSRKCKEQGIDLWCDTTYDTPHLTTGRIGETEFRAYMETHPPLKPIVLAEREGQA